MTTVSRASGASSDDHDLLVQALSQLAELKEDVSEIRDWTEEHTKSHALSDNAFQTHLREAARREVHDEQWHQMQEQLRKLEKFQVQVETTARLVQYVTGASVIGAMAAIASLVLTISHITHP